MRPRQLLHSLLTPLAGFLFGYDIGVISVRYLARGLLTNSNACNHQGCLGMPDFIQRFGELAPDGTYVLSSARQSIIVVGRSVSVREKPRLIASLSVPSASWLPIVIIVSFDKR